MSDYMVDETSGRATVRYGHVAAFFHWLTLLLVLVQLYLGFTFTDLPKGSPERMQTFAWHKTVGATILVLTLIRLAYRLTNPPPPYPREMPEWRRNAAVWSHRFLYFFLIALPLTGLVAVSGSGHATTPLVGGVPLPTVPGVTKHGGEVSGDIHVVLVWTTITLLVLHVSAALYEQFAARAGVAYRMPPFQPRTEESAAIR